MKTLKAPESHAAYYRRKMRECALDYRAAIDPTVPLSLAERGKLGVFFLQEAIWYREMWREANRDKIISLPT